MFAISPLFAMWEVFGQRIELSDLAVVGLLVILEGVLSIDNALVLGLLAKRLPPAQRQRALTYGLIGAFAFRVIAICTASLLLQWTFVKFLGGAYLVYIALKHLLFESHSGGDEKVELDAAGHPIMTDKADAPPRSKPAAFWPTVVVIELTDVAFAVDSILAAMALAGSRVEKLWVVITGGIIGVVLMRFAAVIFIKLLEKFPRFELAAYLLVTVIGVKLLADWGGNSDWSFDRQPWAASKLGAWKETFEGVEQARLKKIEAYDGWLDKNWIFDLPKQELKHAHDDQEAPKDPGKVEVPHTPHLLDFHDLRRPECMTFWVLMMVCFCIGFIRPKEAAPAKH